MLYNTEIKHFKVHIYLQDFRIKIIFKNCTFSNIEREKNAILILRYFSCSYWFLTLCTHKYNLNASQRHC